MIPAILLTQGAEKTETNNLLFAENSEKYIDGSLKLKFFERIYGSTEVRESLGAAQHHKCCYCERCLVEDIEHFRPKNRVSQGRGLGNEKPGYYWLAYEWTNLLYACHRCNVLKGDRFPLVDPARRAKCSEETIDNESPKLIDPASENPRDFIGFRNGVPYGKCERGRTTIREICLNRPSLNQARMKQVRAIKLLVGWLLAVDTQIKSEKIKKIREDTIRELTALCEPTASFSAMTADLLDELNFDLSEY